MVLVRCDETWALFHVLEGHVYCYWKENTVLPGTAVVLSTTLFITMSTTSLSEQDLLLSLDRLCCSLDDWYSYLDANSLIQTVRPTGADYSLSQSFHCKGDTTPVAWWWQNHCFQPYMVCDTGCTWYGGCHWVFPQGRTALTLWWRCAIVHWWW